MAPAETAFRGFRASQAWMRVGGLHCLCTRGWMALEELNGVLSSQRHTETVTDCSGEKAGAGTWPIGQGTEQHPSKSL